MSLERMLIILGGTVSMFVLMFLRRRQFPAISNWKYPLLSILLTVCGVLGALCLYYVENGGFGGTSFFGALLLPIPLMSLVALCLCVKPAQVLDLCAPAECVMLALLKVDCLISGCCSGIVLGSVNGQDIRFPSQIVEMIVILIIMFVLLKYVPLGKQYPWYLMLYGSTRFVLNFARADLSPFVWILPPGHFWSLISIAIGSIWLVILKARSAKTESQPQPS